MEQKQGDKQAHLYEIEDFKILFARDAYSGDVKVYVGQDDNLVVVDRLPYMLIDSEEKRRKFINDFGKRWIAQYKAGQPEKNPPHVSI